MIVPFSVTDFLDRAVAGVRRPRRRRRRARPAGRRRSGDADLRASSASCARAQAAQARRARHRRRRPGRGRVSHNSARLLTSFFGVSGYGRVLVPVNFRLRRRRGRLHRRALRRPGALRRPRARGRARRASTAEHTFVLGDDDDLLRAEGAEPRAVGARRERHRDDQLHVRHDRPAQGRADHPPQHLDQRGRPSRCTPASPTATSTCTRCRCSTPTAGGCRSR